MLTRWKVALRRSIRTKLLALVLLPLAGVLPLLGVLLLVWGDVAFDRMLITKIRADLAVAQGYFERVQAELSASAGAVAGSHALHLALADPGRERLVALLQEVRDVQALDFVNLRDAEGRLLLTDQGSSQETEPADSRARPGRSPADAAAHSRIEVLDAAAFAVLAPRLRDRVGVDVLPTRDAAPGSTRRVERAMVMLASHPVRAPDGRLLGHVQAGRLLNRNLALIDHINAIVYPEGSLPFGSRGTTTLFLDDVRVGTNVRLFGPAQDERAIGTRVSQAVHDAVLVRGSTWLDRAFVVNDWYVSAYQPITDGAGRRVGMLYVGYLERPFIWLKYGMLAGIGVIFFAVMVVAAFVSLRWAGTIFRPVEQMEATLQRIESGAAEARVGALDSTDELGRLARHLDALLDLIADKTRALEGLNAELDAKVAQRTAALEASNRELAATQTQLLRSEKLAAVGQLTASIAHEVNNPIAVIQGNLDLLRSQLPAEVARASDEELRLIDAQIERMRLIVTQLLQFARPAEYAGYVTPLDTAAVVEDCLVLTGHLAGRTRIAVERDLRAAGRPALNRNELQQVLINLIVNAIHAMPEGGTLTLSSRDLRQPDSHGTPVDWVTLSVADTGGGLDAELMDQLFQPFVTRKKDGTGLGLWISRSLVERYGGDLRAAHRDDARSGAVFTVWLRVEA
ncbi:sensor histidine kinase [Leptothrix discophora]|uniref:histidine kinase n=1 Tax=Leptothrix discophora TaxID=89 RepID=A0ABT9G7W2_LEPDI|nr:cache domain-containing protein [Leptothrix discophora]MDP4302557.1 cache domain-containing protein [Leptothrix discophora]